MIRIIRAAMVLGAAVEGGELSVLGFAQSAATSRLRMTQDKARRRLSRMIRSRR